MVRANEGVKKRAEAIPKDFSDDLVENVIVACNLNLLKVAGEYSLQMHEIKVFEIYESNCLLENTLLRSLRMSLQNIPIHLEKDALKAIRARSLEQLPRV